MEYYSAIEKNEIIPFAATWMDLENIKLSEISQRKTKIYDITYMWNLKNNTSECIYKTETNSQTKKTNLWLPKGRGRGEGQIWTTGLTDTK